MLAFPCKYGKYTLLRRIAYGGMAEIFLARLHGPAGFIKEIAIKRILPQFAEDPKFVAMFIDEARLAARLNHPNIVQVSDFHDMDGELYLAMEYVNGPDLRRVLLAGKERAHGLPPELAIAIALEVAKGLHYAHNKTFQGRHLNIIHRDINPHNILVSYEGTVKIADFGIAKVAHRTNVTRSGVIKGKLPYLSPEQVRSEILDGRSDLFSMGVLLYEMLTGKRVFEGRNDAETLQRILTAPIKPPETCVVDCPSALSDLTMKLLSRDRQKRHESATILVRELTSLYTQITPDYLDLGAYVKEVYPPEELEAVGIKQSQRGLDRAVGFKEDATETQATVPDRLPAKKTKKSFLWRSPVMIAFMGVATLIIVAALALVKHNFSSDKRRGHVSKNTFTGLHEKRGDRQTGRYTGIKTGLTGAKIGEDESVPLKATEIKTFKIGILKRPSSASKGKSDVRDISIPVLKKHKVKGPGKNSSRRRRKGMPGNHKQPVNNRTIKEVFLSRRVIGKPHQALGTILITVRPWAHVFLNGKQKGDGPVFSFVVPSGKHTVRIKNDLFNYDRLLNITIKPGQRKHIIRRLRSDN